MREAGPRLRNPGAGVGLLDGGRAPQKGTGAHGARGRRNRWSSGEPENENSQDQGTECLQEPSVHRVRCHRGTLWSGKTPERVLHLARSSW